jgi:hypothetical protein
MAEQKDDWIDTRDRFVAFLDIMGFKDMVFRRTNNSVYKMLLSFRPAVLATEKDIQFISPTNNRIITKTVMFSDSIIIITNDDSEDAALNIIYDVGMIIISALKEKIPMKGAIAYGKQTADFKNSLHFGKPLIDAFELQNELKLYGVIMHHTMEKRIEKFSNKHLLDNLLMCKYPVPMKNGEINHYMVDWMTLHEIKKDPTELVSQLYKNVSGAPRIYVDNTIKFVNKIVKKQAELAHKKKTPSRPATKRKSA